MVDVKLRFLVWALFGLSLLGCSQQGPTAVEQTRGPLDPAIIWGVNDGNDHPWVGLTFFIDENGDGFICSGSFLTPYVFLTAGHCTAPAVQTFILTGNPLDLTNFIPGVSIPHPDFDTSPGTNDVGVVLLSQAAPVTMFAQLPVVGALDQLSRRRGLQNQQMTVVGYGDSGRFPRTGLDEDLSRFQGTPRIVSLNSTGGFFIHLSSNPGQANPGGACFGDSGGPAIVPGTHDVVAGVGSFVLNQNCTGTGFYFRIDTQSALDFIEQFLP